jgi:plasmanylethanolamine desaturase
VINAGSGASAGTALPAHYEVTRAQLLVSAIAIGVAFVAVAVLGARIATLVTLSQWWVLPAFIGGIAAADFASGVVHWAADTWGRDDLPLIGRRLLVPFRVHHINPADFLRRRFVDTNGDVAAIAVPFLLILFRVPLATGWGPPLAVFGLAFCGIGMMTNQIHQWAHMPSPPPAVRLLQRCRLLLGRPEHAAHHDHPYDTRYCITTGWCNALLEAVGFFRRLETAVTRVTGMAPRGDDRKYEERYGLPTVSFETRHG